MLRPLTPDSLAAGLNELTNRDADLARIYQAVGSPPLWQREASFATIMLTILEQKISLASARAVYGRLEQLLGTVTPENYVAQSDDALFSTGMTRSKVQYGRHLAVALLHGTLQLDTLPTCSDDEARAALTKVKGIGPWTANVYLIMVLGRLDVWPVGDRALAVAVQRALGYDAVPKRNELLAIGERWRPWRTVATMLLWHHYLTV